MTLRQLVERTRRDDGLTLSELIVAMMITSLALAVMGGFFANMTRTIVAGRTTSVATNLATSAVDELGKVIRSAANVPTASGLSPAITAGSTGSHLTVLSYIDADSADPAPTRVDFSLNAAGNLVEQRTNAVRDSSNWKFTGATTTRVFPGPFVGSSGMFSYLSDGTSLTVGSAGLTADQVSSISAITVTATIANRGRVGDDPVQLTTTAVMPNLGLT